MRHQSSYHLYTEVTVMVYLKKPGTQELNFRIDCYLPIKQLLYIENEMKKSYCY